MVRRSWGAAVLCLVHASLGYGGEKPPAPSEREIKALIDQLVSPNPKPITGDEDRRVRPDYRLPPGFDRDKQKQVRGARLKLRQLGPRAFPYLIERWGDKRYCLTVSDGLSGYCRNKTVGDVCCSIIFDQLQPYSSLPKVKDDPRGKPHRPAYPAQFLHTQKAAKRWWEKNKHKALYRMQREVLDWVIAEEAKRPRDFTKAERRALRDIRKELVGSGKPLAPETTTWMILSNNIGRTVIHDRRQRVMSHLAGVLARRLNQPTPLILTPPRLPATVPG